MIDSEIECYGASMAGVESENIPVCQKEMAEKSTLAFGSEKLVNEEHSDDDIIFFDHTKEDTPPIISPSAARRIKREVKMLFKGKIKESCAEFDKCPYKHDKVQNSLKESSSLICKNPKAKPAEGPSVKTEGPYIHNNTGISSGTEVSKCGTTLLSRDSNIFASSEISKSKNEPNVLLSTLTPTKKDRESILGHITLTNTTQGKLMLSEKKEIGDSDITSRNEMSPGTTSNLRKQSALSSSDCEVLECKIMTPGNKDDGPGISSGTELSERSTTLLPSDSNIFTLSEISKSKNEPNVLLSTITPINKASRLGFSIIPLTNTTQGKLMLSEKKETGDSDITNRNEMFLGTTSTPRKQPTLSSSDCEVLECKIMTPGNKDDGPGISSGTDLSKHSTTLLSSDSNIFALRKISKTKNEPNVLLTDKASRLGYSIIPLTNTTQGKLMLSEKKDTGDSDITNRNEIFLGTTSNPRKQPTLSSSDCEVLECKIMTPENKDNSPSKIPYKKIMSPSPGMKAGIPNVLQPQTIIPIKMQPRKSDELPTSSDMKNKPKLSSNNKISLSKKKNVNKDINPTDSAIKKPRRLPPSGCPEVSIPKMFIEMNCTSKDIEMIKDSNLQCEISCPLSPLKKAQDVQSELKCNNNYSAIMQNNSELESSTIMQKGNNSSSDVALEVRPAVNLKKEPICVSDIAEMKHAAITLITEKDSGTSTVCNDSSSHMKAKIVKGNIEVPSASSDKQTSNQLKNVNHGHSSKKRKTVDYKAESLPPPPSPLPTAVIEMELNLNMLQTYISILTSGTDNKTNESFDDSAVKGKKTNRTPSSDNMLSAQNLNAASDISTATMRSQLIPLSTYQSKGKEVCSSPKVKRKRMSDSTAGNSDKSVIHDSSVPFVKSGYFTNNSVARIKSAATIHKLKEPVSLSSTYAESEDNNVYIRSKDEQKKMPIPTAEKSNISVQSNSKVPSVITPKTTSSNSPASTTTIRRQSPAIPCNVPGTSSMQPATSSSELETAQPQSQIVKLSKNILQHPRNFSVSKANGFEILTEGRKTLRKKSPSKRLGKCSPIKLMKKQWSQHNWRYRTTPTNEANVSRVLKFDDRSTETTSASTSSTAPEDQSSISNFSFTEEYVPYFEHILGEVLRDKDMLTLINENELKMVTNFSKSENQVKKLYIRMLSRIYSWHRVAHIKYDGINVSASFSELEMVDLVTSDNSSEELEVLLNLLKVPELRSLCQTFRIRASNPKPMLVQALLEYGRNQQTINGSQKSDSSSLVKKRVREMLGHCIKLSAEGREVFRRILLLFSLPHQIDDDDRESSRQILLLHYVKTRRTEFPNYAILKTRPIFSSRDDLIRFEEANELLTGLADALRTKSWDVAQAYGQTAREHFKTLLENSTLSDQAKTMPLFMRRYTAGSTYAYAMTKSIEAFKKSKDLLLQCVAILEELLSQDIYLSQYRGRWYEQLALLLQVHLKNCKQAAETVIAAVEDSHLSEVHQHILSSRGVLLLSRKKGISNNLKLRLVETIKEPLKDPESITIKAKSLQINAPGRKQVYIQKDAQKQETTYSSVEECAICHYTSVGYTQGIHDEGSTIKNLFGLIFWDIIYDHPVADVFRNSYQQEPLDLCSGEFYGNRKETVDKRLKDLSHWDMNDVQCHIERIVEEHEGKASIVNWKWFLDLQQIVGLINCIGVQVLSKILERLVKNYRTVRSGFPDLLVWNPSSSKYKFVEVKGPGDRLSIAQKMWLKYLAESNAHAEVCFVETTGVKMLKRKKMSEEDV